MLAKLKYLAGPDREAEAPRGPSLRRYALAGLVAAASVVVGAVSGGSSFVSHLPGAWLFGTPGGPLSFVSSSATPPAVSILAVYGGLAALLGIWWRLLVALRVRPGIPVGQVVRVLVVWAVPFLLAPPLFSRDAYSYAGQGALVSFHIDPYHYGPGVLGATRFNLLAGPLWANSPSPYGPTFLSLDGLMTRLSGHQVLVDLVLLRLLAVAAVLPILARQSGKDPATALVLGVGSPLVLVTLIGGEHNDALMVGLLVAGLAAWRRWGPVPSVVLCALAAGVKAPAVLGVVAIGWNWETSATYLRRALRTLEALGIGAATLAALSSFTGIGWGWIVSLNTPGKISTGVTPVDGVARVVAGVLHLLGASTPTSTVRGATSVVGLAVAGCVGAWLLWRSPRTGVLRAVGLSLLVLALLGPILWSWYLTWGIVVLAPVATGALRRLIVPLVLVETMVGVTSVQGMVRTLVHEGLLAVVLVLAGIGALAFAALSCRFAAGAPRIPPFFGGRRAAVPTVPPVPAAQPKNA